MITKRLLSFSILFFVVVFFLTTAVKENSLTKFNLGEFLATTRTSNTAKPKGIHKVEFFDEKTFNEGINRARINKKSLPYHAAGGIIPHHLLAGFIIADFFDRLSSQKPTTIILLGPNHDEKGNFKALTSLYSWDTPSGIVAPDDSIINTLIDYNLVKVNEEILPSDHSLSGIMPFIKYYAPDTKVVPILLSGGLTKDESEVLANRLSTFVTKDVIVVASVDFSHYLTSGQAKEKDETTFQVIRNFDYRRLYLLNNDYFDSPSSVGIFLMMMQKLGTTKMDLLYHVNSGELQKDEYIQTTSYFSIAYH